MKRFTTTCVLFSTLLLTLPVFADSAMRADIGLRADLNVAPGKPANDIPGLTILAHIPLQNDWLIGLAASTTRFEVERPVSDLGLTSTRSLDADASSIMFSSWIERRMPLVDNSYWYWTAGVGINSVDVDNLKGTTTTLDTFNIAFDVNTEIELALTAGKRHHITPHWVLGYGLKAGYRFSDWNAHDLNSNASGNISHDYDISGAFAETLYRF